MIFWLTQTSLLCHVTNQLSKIFKMSHKSLKSDWNWHFGKFFRKFVSFLSKIPSSTTYLVWPEIQLTAAMSGTSCHTWSGRSLLPLSSQTCLGLWTLDVVLLIWPTSVLLQRRENWIDNRIHMWLSRLYQSFGIKKWQMFFLQCMQEKLFWLEL